MRGGTHLLVLDTETGMVQADFDNQDQWLRRIIVSPDGRHVVTAKVEGRHAILWDIRSPTATKVAKLSHKFWIPKVVFSPDGTLVATAALDGTVHLWDAETGSLVKTFSDDSGLIDAQFSQNGNFLVTKNENETVRIWSVGRADSGFTVHDINESAAKLDTIVVSPDQQLTVTFCNEDCLELQKMDSGQLVKTLPFTRTVIARGKAKKVALVACARKILVWAWTLFSQQTDWSPNFHKIGA